MYTPDPPPHTGHRPVTIMAYEDYDMPAYLKSGQRLYGYVWHCRRYRYGRRICILFTTSEGATL